jgi:two-component system NtrC family sensor kinase
MVITIVLSSLVPLLVIAGTILYYFEISYRAKTIEHLKVLSRKHARLIDTYLTDKLADIKAMALSYPFGRLADESFLRERLLVLHEVYGRNFVDLGLVDQNGVQVAYAGPYRLERADYSEAPWFRRAINLDEYISDVFPGLRGHPHFIVTVRADHGGSKYILRATVDFELFNSLVENIAVGTTGFAFIINKQGDFQSNPRFEVAQGKERFLALFAEPPGSGGPEEVRVVEEKGPDGRDCLHIMSRLKNGDWLLAYQQNVEDAFSVVYLTRRIAVAIFILGLSLMVAVSVVLSRRMVRRIYEADQQKEMMNEQVIEAGKLASLGELAAGIAHEINNPVAIMVEEAGWIQDLLQEEDLKGSPNAEEFQRALTQIRTQGQRCKDITFKLLSFARKTDPTLKSVQINDLVEDVVALSHQRARYGNIKIKVNLTPDLPEVMVSPSEMQQVLLNLINNSCDAIDARGGTIEISTRKTKDHTVVDVTDDGPGIPQPNLARIFDPFFTTKPVGKGTGLGLSICYGIVKKIGGDITVNSAVGVGTTFHVYIPLAPEHEGKPAENTPA